MTPRPSSTPRAPEGASAPTPVAPAPLSSLRSLLLLPLLSLLALSFAAPGPVRAQEGEEEPAAEQAQEQEGQQEEDQEKQPDRYRDFGELTEGAEAHEGFLDLYAKDDKLYLAVPRDRLGRDFLLETKIARGAGANFLFGGLMMSFFDPAVVAVEKHGPKLYLVQRPHRFSAEDDPRAAEAVELSFSSSVLQSAKVVSVREDSAWVAEVGGWFVSDLSGVSEMVKEAVSEGDERPGSARLDKGRSYLEGVEAFPDNVNVQAKLTFAPGDAVSWPSVPDGRYLPLSIHYTLARLPEEPMEPRLGDDRVGYFWTAHKDFSDTDSTFFVRMSRKWRLEKGERVGDGWRPKEPITYYIDSNVPEEYREPMKAGVEAWNEAFEAAGWVDAIRAEDLPEGADPDDIRYATLRWNVSDQPSYGAIGPSVVDPRTGEVLDADVLFEASMFAGIKDEWRDLVNPVSASEALRRTLGTGRYAEAWTEDGTAGGGDRGAVELPGFASTMMEQGALLRTSLVARGVIAPAEPVPDEYVDQFVTWVTMHEVGHTLGLQHNFRSSASTPFERLHDESWTRRNGVASSVMEYPSVNLAPEGEETGHYWSPGPGSYDRWAVAHGYTPDPERAERLARQAAEKEHLFGNEAGGPGALDPTINIWDLGDDPLAWGRQRTGIVRGLWQRLPEYALEDGDRYFELTVAFQSLLNQYVQAVAPALKYLGGAYLNRDHVGDPGGRLPLEPVAVEDQREALGLLVDRVLAPGALEVPDAVLQRLAPNRWTHWGTSTTFDGRLDYPWRQQVAGLQETLLEELLHPWRLSRIRDAEARWGEDRVVGIPELTASLTDAVWSELETGASVSARRRDLQRAWVDAMTELVVDAPPRTPADARSVARVRLREVGREISGVLEGDRSGLDAYTTAHLEESAARIREALDAGLEIQR